MDRRWGMVVVLLTAGCNYQDRTIDDALAKMQGEIMDGTKVVVDRSSVTLHYREEGRKAICGVAQVTPGFTGDSGHSEQQHFVVFAHDPRDPVMFFFDGVKEPEGRETFKKLWNDNCVG